MLLQSRIMAVALGEIGICECFWGELGQKQAQFPLLGMVWNCAADEKWGEPYLPEQMDAGMFSFPVIFLSRQQRSQDYRRSLEREGHLFPCGHHHVAVITHGIRCHHTFPRWHFQTGNPRLSLPVHRSSNFPNRKQSLVSPALSESASPWRFQLTPATSLAHNVTFCGLHGQNLFS